MGVVLNIIIILFSIIKPSFQDNLDNNSILGVSIDKNYVLLQNSPHIDFAVWKNLKLDSTTKVSAIIHIPSSSLGLAVIDDQNNFIRWLPSAEIKDGNDWPKGIGDHLDWWGFEDINGGNNNEFYAQFAFAGTASVHPFYLYSYKNGEFKLLLKLSEARSKAEVIDLDNDGIKEIVYKYALSGSGNRERETLRWKDIWRLENGKPIKVNNQFPDEYKELIPIYDRSLTSKYNEDFYESDYPVYKCLKEKALQNISGQFADAKECGEIYYFKYK